MKHAARPLVLVLPALCAFALSTCRPGVRAGAPQFDEGRALQVLRELTRQCPERRPEGACGQRALRVIGQSLRSSGYRVLTHRSVWGRGPERLSVMAVRTGKRPGEVVLAAHHDTVPGSPGALDDAAGVALVLEIARVMRRRTDGYSLRFALFDGEEDGLLGSRAFVRSLSPRERARLVAAVAVEMPGARGGAPVLHTFRPPRGATPGALPPASMIARAMAAARSANVELALGDPSISLAYQVLTRHLRVPFAADDLPFAAAGVPAFFYSDSSLTRFYPHYHQPTDTMAALDRRAFARAGRAVEAIVSDLRFGEPTARGGSSEALVVGTRVARGPLLWVCAALLCLPLASALRRARPGAVLLLGAGYGWLALLSLSSALVLLGPALVVSPLVGASRAAIRAAKLVALAPILMASVVYAMASRMGGLSLETGASPVLALAVGLVGAGMLRERTSRRTGPRA